MEHIWKSLVTLTEELGFTLSFKDDMSRPFSVNGNFEVKNESLHINMYNAEVCELEKIVTLAHELGHGKHALEFSSLSEYSDTYYQNIVPFEWQAWLYAEEILKNTSFDQWDYFFKDREACYKRYKLSVEEPEKAFWHYLQEEAQKMDEYIEQCM